MLSLLSLLLVPAAAVAHNVRPNHSNIHPAQNASLATRDGPGYRFSNYDAAESEGACGGWNTNSQYVVAMSQIGFDGGAHCHKQVYITYNGMSAVAEIVDECMECPHMALDFSQALFGHFVGGEQNNEEVGYIYGPRKGGWVYGTGPSGGGGGGGDDDDDDTTTKKTTTTTKKTTTTSHTTSTTSHTTSTTTSHTSSTHTSSSASPSATSKTSASASAGAKSAGPSSTGAAGAVPTGGPQNLQNFAQALLNLAGVAVQAPQAAA
ncbi:hypothetical protein C8R46DRAFT_467699 [Mycena filopes]|nr:hypothetical protein C8R46DRAFT_467699 [Mycena filopes]